MTSVTKMRPPKAKISGWRAAETTFELYVFLAVTFFAQSIATR
jgi:hypothetical protein